MKTEIIINNDNMKIVGSIIKHDVNDNQHVLVKPDPGYGNNDVWVDLSDMSYEDDYIIREVCDSPEQFIRDHISIVHISD